jgi:hypothetical protein
MFLGINMFLALLRTRFNRRYARAMPANINSIVIFYPLGNSDRTRTRRKLPSCGGRACGSLSQRKVCTQYINHDCQMGAWSSWSVCDNGCGQGRQRKTRKITQQPVCRGRQCGSVEAFKVCTDYRNNRDCQVSQAL